MKAYPRKYQDLFVKRSQFSNVAAVSGTIEDLAARFRDFYDYASLVLFDMILKETWLEGQFIANGCRRLGRCCGPPQDISFAKFMKGTVGKTSKAITSCSVNFPVYTYFLDFFPNFFLYDPFEQPEKYAYPYKHISLDFLLFVYQMDNRLEFLQEAEEKKFLYAEFANKVANWAFCFNQDVGYEKYIVGTGDARTPMIRNRDYKPNKALAFRII